ncbi:MAG: cytochrome c biogenesis protein ResB [Bacillaceae bacterium]|nr:cytochrome c biogenesis protein ResB [Bacillaceae bacterium]
MEDVKCECGHANPVGTVLCESCGKPLQQDEGETAFPDMRYDGVSRRSQTYSRTLVDKVWNFFSSVRNAVIMIIIVLIASAVGTVFPQEQYIPTLDPPEIYYEKAHGTLGKIYYQLGFHNLYTSWWYITLLLMIGISLVICSLDRVVPLYRALKKLPVKRHPSFLKGQQVYTQFEIDETEKERTLEQLEKGLKQKRYRVVREGNALVAEKGRFSRWGPYVNHIGLILVIIGVLMRLLPGFYLNDFVWVREGETKQVPGTPYYVKNVEFIEEYYEEEDLPEGVEVEGRVVKNYQTDAILYEQRVSDIPGAPPELVEVHRDQIRVNHPLKYKDLLLYQAERRINQLSALNLELIDNRTGESIGAFKLDLYNPPADIQLTDEITIQILEYYQDFEWTEDNQPRTKSPEPNNPAFVVSVISPQTPEGERSWIFLGSTLGSPDREPFFSYRFNKPDIVDSTGLMVRKEKSLPFIYFGSGVVMVGLIMGFYWQHRRIWIDLNHGPLQLAAHTNKNWYGLKREILQILKKMEIDVTIDQLSKGGKSK